MGDLELLLEKCRSAGIHECAVISPDEIEFSEEVRKICADNQCGQYGKTWACPPGVGSVEECRKKCREYEHTLIFTTKSKLEDSYDYDGMIEGKRFHEEISDRVREIFIKEYPDILMLSSEGCQNCKTCTYPNTPCRFPDRMYPSVESYGIYVHKEAMAGGIRYINGENTVTYFSNLFFGRV